MLVTCRDEVLSQMGDPSTAEVTAPPVARALCNDPRTIVATFYLFARVRYTDSCRCFNDAPRRTTCPCKRLGQRVFREPPNSRLRYAQQRLSQLLAAIKYTGRREMRVWDDPVFPYQNGAWFAHQSTTGIAYTPHQAPPTLNRIKASRTVCALLIASLLATLIRGLAATATLVGRCCVRTPAPSILRSAAGRRWLSAAARRLPPYCSRQSRTKGEGPPPSPAELGLADSGGGRYGARSTRMPMEMNRKAGGF